MFRSSPFELTGPIADFDAIKIQLASPEKIQSPVDQSFCLRPKPE